MKLMPKEKIAFGLGAVGKDMVYAIVAGFILYYYNTVLGISAAFVGSILMVTRIFDALNDPFMGIIVDKTKSKFGKYRPWILSGTILNAFVLYAMFAVPRSLSGSGLLWYASMAYLVWSITYTIMDIPYWSLIPAITEAGKDRENISVIGRTCAGFGNALITVGTMIVVPILGGITLVGGKEIVNYRDGFRWFALIIAVIFVITELILVIFVKDKIAPKEKTATVKEMLQALIRNDQTVAVVITIVLVNSSIYLTSNLLLYFFQYDIKSVGMYSLFSAFGGATQILSMMLIPLLRKKWSGKQIFVGSVSLAILGYVLLLLMAGLGVSASMVYLVFIPGLCIFVGVGLTTVLTTVFMSDSVDYGEYQCGQRNESLTFSMQTFVVKFASAIAVFIAGVGIEWIGLQVITVDHLTLLEEATKVAIVQVQDTDTVDTLEEEVRKALTGALADPVDASSIILSNSEDLERVDRALETTLSVYPEGTMVSDLSEGIDEELASAITEELIRQDDSAIVGLRMLMSVVPIIILTLAIIFFLRRYHLTQERLEEITLELKKRHGKE